MDTNNINTPNQPNQPQNPVQDTPPPSGETPKQSPLMKYKFVIIVVVLLLVLSVVGLLSMNRPQTNTEQSAPPAVEVPTPEATPTPEAIPTTIQPSAAEVKTDILLSPQEIAAIDAQIKPELASVIDIGYTVQKAKLYGTDWAILVIANPTTDPANVIVKKEKGTWKLKLGPGTLFDENEVRSLGAPESLIREVNIGF